MRKGKFLALLTAAATAISLMPASIATVSAAEPVTGAFVRDASALDETVKGTIQSVPAKNQIMYVTFNTAPAESDYLWFEVVSPLGDTYGIQAKGDGKHTTFAWSYLDKKTVASWPTRYDMEIPTGAQSGEYTVKTFKSNTEITSTPSAEAAATTKIKADRKGDVRLTNTQFRAHPETSSVFNIDEGDSANFKNLLWTEFSNKIDHKAAFDGDTRTYTLDNVCYQLEIARPAHGPAIDRHASKSIIPNNGIVGNVSAGLTDGDSKHRYHGWNIGQGSDLFEQDTTHEYQTGKYIVNLWQLDPTEAERGTAASGKTAEDKILKCEDKMLVSSHAINITEVTYTLSYADKQADYKLQCPIEQAPADTITELALEGDWITVVDPSIVCPEGTNKTISGWQIKETGEAVGNKIPAGDADGTDDNKITLEAVLSEPKSYDYGFQKDADGGAAIEFDTEVSFNELVSDNGTPVTVEYGDRRPLTLRLVNKGNQRSYIPAYSKNDLLDVKRINLNTDPEAQKMYSDGGLDANKPSFWYIPPADQTSQQYNWKNYALVEITPRAGLTVGKHNDAVCSMNYTEGRIVKSFNISIEVAKANPTPNGDITVGTAEAGTKLSDVKINGTFINPHNSAAVEGTLEWENASDTIKDGTNSYGWRFTPKDGGNYNTVTGSVSVTAGGKIPDSVQMEQLLDAVTHNEDGTVDRGFATVLDNADSYKSLKVTFSGADTTKTAKYPLEGFMPKIESGTVKLGLIITGIPEKYSVDVKFSTDAPVSID